VIAVIDNDKLIIGHRSLIREAFLARYRESVCRLCRREGLKLFLKGDRCYSEKCAFERRGYAPGDHGQLRKKFSDYGVQLREKQKLKRMYGLLEKQFRGYFDKADRQKGITGSNLLVFLERRLDNMIFRMGFANSRSEARQLVRHNHFLVSGKPVNIPSYLIKLGDDVQVREGSRKVERILEAMETVARRGVPQWLEIDKANFKGVVKVLPTREELTMPVREQLVVELYSK
jgi:small subunit ribosomal protein S4